MEECLEAHIIRIKFNSEYSVKTQSALDTRPSQNHTIGVCLQGIVVHYAITIVSVQHGQSWRMLYRP